MEIVKSSSQGQDHHLEAMKHIQDHHNGKKIDEKHKEVVINAYTRMRGLFNEKEQDMNLVMKNLISDVQIGLASISGKDLQNLTQILEHSIQTSLEKTGITGRAKEYIQVVARDIQKVIDSVQKGNESQVQIVKQKVLRVLGFAATAALLIVSNFNLVSASNAPIQVKNDKNPEAGVSPDIQMKGMTSVFESEEGTNPDSIKTKKIEEINNLVLALRKTDNDEKLEKIIGSMLIRNISLQQISIEDSNIKARFSVLYNTLETKYKINSRNDQATLAREQARKLEKEKSQIINGYTYLVSQAHFRIDSAGQHLIREESIPGETKTAIEALKQIDLKLFNNGEDTLLVKTYQDQRNRVKDYLIEKEIFTPELMNLYECGLISIIGATKKHDFMDPINYKKLVQEVLLFSSQFKTTPTIAFVNSYGPQIIE